MVTLGKGLSVSRSTMTLHINPKGGGFTTRHFAPLEDHYSEQTVQTHVMAAYASKGIDDIDQAQRLAHDCFAMEQSALMQAWMPGKISEFRRQATPRSHAEIVDNPGNSTQEQIVRDDREQTNVLVRAGPGSCSTARSCASRTTNGPSPVAKCR